MSTVKVNFVCATSDVLGVSSNSGEISSTSDTVTLISCSTVSIPSVTVTVAVYENLVSKSGFAAKVITPVEVSITNSSPEMVYSRVASASGSVAAAVPIANWFSGAVNEASEVNEGAQFIRFFSEIM